MASGDPVKRAVHSPRQTRPLSSRSGAVWSGYPQLFNSGIPKARSSHELFRGHRQRRTVGRSAKLAAVWAVEAPCWSESPACSCSRGSGVQHSRGTQSGTAAACWPARIRSETALGRDRRPCPFHRNRPGLACDSRSAGQRSGDGTAWPHHRRLRGMSIAPRRCRDRHANANGRHPVEASPGGGHGVRRFWPPCPKQRRR